LAALPDEAENLCQGSILLLNKAQSQPDIKKLGQSEADIKKLGQSEADKTK
jgi:hypothetical protein